MIGAKPLEFVLQFNGGLNEPLDPVRDPRHRADLSGARDLRAGEGDL